MVCIRNQQHIKNIYYHTGFTLVELVVVILIVGILSISVAPRFFGVSSYEVRKVSDEILSALRHTQQMAMARGGGTQFVLTATNFTVLASGGANLRSPDGRMPYTRTFPDNVNISPVPNTITYDQLGQPNSTAGYTITVGSKTITIEQVTGYVH